MKDAFRYSFRFCCDPGFNDQREVQALLKYVDDARIDDVAVFANVQEINNGHLTLEEQKVFLTLMDQLKQQLEPKGVSLSVNHWHTIMHADLGKGLKDGQQFRLMVDPKGNQASLCVCPLCENWQAYFCEIYARYAQLNPEIVWVEDDFRFHNHAPLYWGGCFCDEHMSLYSRKAGKELTREEFIQGVLKPGEVHPYRRIWLDTCRETLVAIARRVGQVVRENSSECKVGLMSSAPHIHAAEGRDWQGILEGLACGAPKVNRIHLPGYVEPTAKQYLQNFNMVSMLSRHFVPRDTEIYPELENFPYSLFTKSRRFTRYQLLSSLPLDEAGMTIDLYDLNGNGIVWLEKYQDMLRDTKDYLNKMTQEGVFKRDAAGVKVMCCEASSYTLHTTEGKNMEELYPEEVFFAGLLPGTGIPFRYCSDPDVRDSILAISGQYLRNLTPDAIVQLFENNFVILNGDSLDTLCEMGLGHLAGVRSIQWLRQDSGAYTYEQVTNGKVYCETPKARASALLLCSDVLAVEYDEPVEEYTSFYNSFHQRTCAGQAVVQGRVYIYPFGRFTDPLDIPPMLMNGVRQAIMQEIVQMAMKGREAFPLVEYTPYLAPYYYPDENEKALYLVNASTDPVEEIRLRVHGLESDRVILCPSDGPEQVMKGECKEGVLVIKACIPSLETAMIYFK